MAINATFSGGSGINATFQGRAPAGSGIQNVVEDTTPQLGGNLDLNGNNVGDASATDLTKLSEVTVTSSKLNTVANEYIVIACSDETTDLTSGTAKASFRMPFAATITDVRAEVNTAPTGSTLIVDINDSGTTILSTKLSIDVGETTSETAATPPVISDDSIAEDAIVSIDIDQVGSSTAGTGLKVTIICTR